MKQHQIQAPKPATTDNTNQAKEETKASNEVTSPQLITNEIFDYEEFKTPETSFVDE